MTVYIVSELMHVELILCDIRREVSAYPIGIRYINKVPECNTIFLSFGIVGCERCSVQVIHPVCTYYRVVVLVVEMSYRHLPPPAVGAIGEQQRAPCVIFGDAGDLPSRVVLRGQSIRGYHTLCIGDLLRSEGPVPVLAVAVLSHVRLRGDVAVLAVGHS